MKPNVKYTVRCRGCSIPVRRPVRPEQTTDVVTMKINKDWPIANPSLRSKENKPRLNPLKLVEIFHYFSASNQIIWLHSEKHSLTLCSQCSLGSAAFGRRQWDWHLFSRSAAFAQRLIKHLREICSAVYHQRWQEVIPLWSHHAWQL